MCWIVLLISATGHPVALTLETGNAMPSATTRGSSFCATLRDLGKRPFRETDCELFICKLLFNPIDTTSRRQHTKHPFKAPTTTPGRSDKHTSEHQYLMRITSTVFCSKQK